MEKKDILAVIFAAAVVILVIGILGIMRSGSNAQPEDSGAPATSARPAVTQQTNLWDMIHEQQSAITTTQTTSMAEDLPVTVPVETDENGNVLTDEAGHVVTAAPAETDSAETGEDVQADTETDENGETVTEAIPEVPAVVPQQPAQTEIQISLE